LARAATAKGPLAHRQSGGPAGPADPHLAGPVGEPRSPSGPPGRDLGLRLPTARAGAQSRRLGHLALERAGHQPLGDRCSRPGALRVRPGSCGRRRQPRHRGNVPAHIHEGGRIRVPLPSASPLHARQSEGESGPRPRSAAHPLAPRSRSAASLYALGTGNRERPDPTNRDASLAASGPHPEVPGTKGPQRGPPDDARASTGPLSHHAQSHRRRRERVEARPDELRGKAGT
jgi:hypothetical protein